MTGNLLFAVLAALGGAAIAAQSGTNAMMARTLGSVVWAIAFSTALSTVLVVAYGLLARTPSPATDGLPAMPWWGWIGGALGVAMLMGSVIAAPRLGATGTIASIVAGQLIASVLLDHFGLVGFQVQPLSLQRVAGVLLLLGGVALILRS